MSKESSSMKKTFWYRARIKWIFSFMICGVILVYNINNVRAIDYENITSIEAKNRLDVDQNVFLLDVRSSYEFYEDGHILGAININIYYLSYCTVMLPSSNLTSILVYCDNGIRSKTAAQRLCEYGYTNVSNMEDGFNGWKSNGFPYIIGTDPMTTSEIASWKVYSFPVCLALLLVTKYRKSKKKDRIDLL
ncbi:MAG: rhodanese-like domain-containing protein [Candidatus Heimdallarchaeota archaeon]|nr:rhodanese-like domain-containing protein [Candidatus Heimdallarchaeota archaeon]